MFKPAFFVYLALTACLAGCASSHTHNAVSAAPAQQSAPPQASASPNTSPAGSDTSSNGARTSPAGTRGDGFLMQDGQLAPEAQAYAEQVASQLQIPLGHVEALLMDTRYNPAVARLMSPAKTTKVRKSWVTYRKRFVEPIRIRAGVQFWQENQEALNDTAKKYGVPPSIIVAIIGVETVYGRYTGNFSVLDALATLAFRYPDPNRPERTQLFRDQLADLIQLDHAGELDARTALGSFAGAMGLPQFMPGSLLRYAANGDGDQTIDLHNSRQDAIASVARFLREHGWQPGLPVFAPVSLPASAGGLVQGGLEPTYTWAQLQAHGASAQAAGAWQHHKLGIVDLVDEPRNQAEYRSGTPNFFAITHYNRSYFYAASVADLARELASRMGYGDPNE